MAIRSRRKAREAALQALYEVEVGHSPAASAVKRTLDEAKLPSELAAYMEEIVKGVRAHLAEIDDHLARLITEYSFDRVAVIDRNVMRIAAFELFYNPAVPPAVSLNEAIDLAKKFSTAESGRFVNGVLGRLLIDSPKANWDPSSAPAEFSEEAAPEPEPELVEQEQVLEADSDEVKKYARSGWILRTPDPSEEP